MKQIIIKSIVLFAALLIGTTFAEAKKHQLTPEQQLEKIQDSIAFVKAKTALENMEFVISADRISFKTGRIFNVTGNTNFISAHDGTAVVQIAKMAGAGFNGLGGVTVTGSVSYVKPKVDKKGNFYLEFSVTGANISARVTINLPKNSVNAIATVYPNFNSDTLTLYGDVKEYDRANVFQGRGL